MNSNFTSRVLILVVNLLCIKTVAQDLNIGSGADFYLFSNTTFTAGDSSVDVDPSGEFHIEAGTNWTTSTEFINGKATVFDDGTTVVNVGDVNQSTITITTQLGDKIICDYTKSTPSGALSAALSANYYVLSDTEFWNVSKQAGSSLDVSTSGLTADASATYGGNAAAGSTIIVRFNTVSNQWEDYSTSPGFGDFAIAADQQTLNTIDDPIVSNFNVYPNPVRSGGVLFVENVDDSFNTDMVILDITGKRIASYNSLKQGLNSINIGNLECGMYFFQFNINKDEKRLTKKIIIKK